MDHRLLGQRCAGLRRRPRTSAATSSCSALTHHPAGGVSVAIGEFSSNLSIHERKTFFHSCNGRKLRNSVTRHMKPSILKIAERPMTMI